MESTHQTQLITISPKAAEKVTEFMKQENKDSLYLRVYVSGGGVLGFHMAWVLKKNQMKMTVLSIKTELK